MYASKAHECVLLERDDLAERELAESWQHLQRCDDDASVRLSNDMIEVSSLRNGTAEHLHVM